MLRPELEVIDSVPFRFDADRHEYTDLRTGEVVPHITGMLEKTGWVDDTWLTEASKVRGTAVHALTAKYDLGAIDVLHCSGPHRGWLLAHAKAMATLRPEILAVEEPHVHAQLGFAGRPDRIWKLGGAAGTCDEKSGPPHKSHAIQTALQAILVAPVLGLPALGVLRWALYLKSSGKFQLVQHRDGRDFIEAHKVIRACCPT